MQIIVRIVCFLMLMGAGWGSQKVLNFSLLSEGETVSVSLASYLDAPKQATLDKVHSLNIEALATELTTGQPMLNVSAVPLQVRLPNGSEYSFSAAEVLESCSLYNQPNKLFLMRGNLVLSIRYQFSASDSPSSVAAAVVEGNEDCTELNVMESHGKYYAVVGCLRSENESVLHAFRFNSSDPSTVNGLVALNSLALPLASCLRLETYSFPEFTLQLKTYYNSVLFYCAEGVRGGEPSNLYFASIESRKGVDTLVAVEPTYSLPARSLRRCLAGSEWVGRYEQGLLVQQDGRLSYFHGELCDEVMEVPGVEFVDGVEEQEVQCIYVMFADSMIVKESYSPNFQTVPLRRPNNLTLHSYAIARRFLALLFDNATHQALTVYDLVRAYPTEIDQVSWPKTKAQMTAFPVANFLDSGNYFLMFDQLTGLLVLNYYQGYLFSFSVSDSAKAVPHVTVNISNQQNQNLVLECTIRPFNDSSIAEAPESRFLKTYRDQLTVNLSDYVQGPLARFYNYPNNISAFQYINEFSEVDLSAFLQAHGRPLAISFNNYLNAAVINFYYAAQTTTCELDFALDTQAVSLADCKTLSRRKSQLDSPQEIVVLSEDKYLQYNQSVLEYCALSSNNEFECLGIGAVVGVGAGGFGRVRLVKYFYTKDTDEVIELLVHNSGEVLFCCLQRNVYSRAQFNYTLHFHTTSANLPDLASWAIQKLLFDPGYTLFLVLHLANGSAHRVVVFAKPAAVKNGSSFIGHVMQKLEFGELEAVFSSGNLLLCVSPQLGGWLLQEYKITKYFRVKETRRYPLYHLALAPAGLHAQDGDFIYLHALEHGRSVYAVYSPLQSSFGVLSHKFAKESDAGVLFAQQLGEVSGNSMGLNGGRLFGLVNPELTFKFLASSPQGPQMGKYEFKVGVLDSGGVMNLLAYEFDYNQGEENIRYDGDLELDLQFDDDNHYAEFQINPEKVHGPVNDYKLQLPTDNSCGFFSVEARDVFTKEGCLAYSNPAQFGSLTDFLALEKGGVTLELLVTDSALMCVLDRRIAREAGQRQVDLNGLANCKFQQSQEDILMVCDNATSFGKLLFRVSVGAGGLGCTVGLEALALPQWFSYVDFAVKASGQWLLLEVPIRYRQNCIYYKTAIVNGQISDTYSLLVGTSPTASEFETRDTSIGEELFFILDRGMGIYNLSDSAAEIMPALWLSQADLLSVSSDDGTLAYLKFISLAAGAGGELSITVEVGTEQSAYEVVVEVVAAGSAVAGQTNYSKAGVRVAYQYRQYMSCRNNLQSKSQNFGSLTIKICSYEPPDELVFANFVSVANDTPRALIQFYNRSGATSFPFRTDTIYSNALSHHSFLIRGSTLIVASLFNLLCYYALANTLRWQFQYLNASSLADPDRQSSDLRCEGALVISNLQFRKELRVQVSYDKEEAGDDYWSNGSFYIQRILLLLLLANAVRLLWRARSKRTTKLRKRFSTRVHTNRFEVMVKINSKRST